MARVITFYIPEGFRPKVKWVPSPGARQSDRVSARAVERDRLRGRICNGTTHANTQKAGPGVTMLWLEPDLRLVRRHPLHPRQQSTSPVRTEVHLVQASLARQARPPGEEPC